MCYADPDASLEVGSGSQLQGERALPASAPSAPLNHESGSQRPSREGFQCGIFGTCQMETIDSLAVLEQIYRQSRTAQNTGSQSQQTCLSGISQSFDLWVQAFGGVELALEKALKLHLSSLDLAGGVQSETKEEGLVRPVQLLDLF